MLTKIISGGQTGADRAALDVAIEFHIPHGGWIPKGRRTENGNEELMQSCRSLLGRNDLHEETASAIIIKTLRERLRQTHGLKVVK